MRVLALTTVGHWAQPPARDPVLGCWRPMPSRPPTAAIEALRDHASSLRSGCPPPVQRAFVAAVEGLAATDLAPALIDVVRDPDAAEPARVAALLLLESWKHPSLAMVAEITAADAPSDLRREAFRVMALLDPEAALPTLQLIAEKAPVEEQRAALAVLAAMEDEAADAMLASWLDRLLAGSVPPEVRLDLIEAAAERDAEEVRDKLARYQASKPADDPLSPYVESLAGGNRRAGRKIFRQHATATCLRCHTVGGKGRSELAPLEGDVAVAGDPGAGPDLAGVGTRRTRRELLESLIEPSRAIAPGFGTVAVTLRDGSFRAGLLVAEDETSVRLEPPGDEPAVTVLKKDIEQRSPPSSAMPPMGSILTRRELRDLVEYLASLK
jgi:putative heme-binding domain-containing protein